MQQISINVIECVCFFGFFYIHVIYILYLDALTGQQRQFTGIHDEAGVQVQVICEETTKNGNTPLTFRACRG